MKKKKKNRKYDGMKLTWLRDGKKFVLILAALFVLFRFVIGVSFVDGDSMVPCLKNGQIVFYSRLSKHCEQGDIVSVRMPGGAYYIKRVVAVSGDTVDIRDGKLWINNVEDSHWGIGATEPQSSAVKYPLEIGEGQIFAVGDNREVSVDCRTFGAVSETQVRGILFKKG